MVLKYIIILTLFLTVKSSKILVVVPTPSLSHKVVFRSLIEELVNRDHEVTVITPDPVYPQGTVNKLSEIDLHNLSYSLWQKAAIELSDKDESNLTKLRVSNNRLMEIFMEQLKDKSVLKLIRDKTVKFDLLIVESCIPGTLIFSHIFKAPVISMSSFGASFGNSDIIGSEIHPLLYPMFYQQKIYNLTLWEKIYQMYFYVVHENIFEEQELSYNRKFKSFFGIETPSMNEMKNNIHMMFLNVHPIWIDNQPVPPNVVSIWGINKLSKKILTTELQSYLDSSKNGVIYFSFGSIFKTTELLPEVVDIFIKVFSRLPYDILWKWDIDELPGKSKNIKISKWLPQYDVLRHPKLKLFITHGGLGSTNEAISAGVPVLGIPQFGDQEYNTEKYPHLKIGIKLDCKSITIENFENAINTILTNYDSYKQNVIRLRSQMYDQPMQPLEHVIWRIDYLLRHGGVQHLRAPAANMPWIDYYEVELILLMLSGLIFLGTVFIVTVTWLLRIINFKVKTKMYNKARMLNVESY